MGTGVSVLSALKKGLQGWIRTAAEPTAACGGNREARLGQRSAFSKPCQGAAEKAASATRKTRRIVRWGKKPLRGFFRCAAREIHPRPPRTPVSNGYRSFCFICFEKGDARVDSNSCGAVAEDSAKTAQWAVFSSAARVIHPRPPPKCL